MKILLVLAGGGLGALSRWGVSLLAAGLFGSKFPWGTLIVNLTGCFLIGFLYSLGDRTTLVNHSVRLFFMTGYCGALTTFSTYALETVNSTKMADSSIAIANFFFNNIFGVALVFLGIWIGRLI
jgi:fluoride exporter